MARKSVPKLSGLRVFPPAPKGFDALGATKRSLARHGLPERPDPRTQPGPAALWERHARRYRGFEHLAPELAPGDQPTHPDTAALTLSALENCGFELFSSAPITIFSGTWSVPNLNHVPNPWGPIQFRTFFSLGFLDVHVEMTVDSSQNVASLIRIHNGAQLALAVRPGDAISAVLCLQTNSAGTANYYLANETTSRTVNFQLDTGFPPAVTIGAGIGRSLAMGPSSPLARFGMVYFDELQAFSTGGARYLPNGAPTTMTDTNGSTLAKPLRFNDYAFKVVYEAD
jgi:hypothetical protein